MLQGFLEVFFYDSVHHRIHFALQNNTVINLFDSNDESLDDLRVCHFVIDDFPNELRRREEQQLVSRLSHISLVHDELVVEREKTAFTNRKYICRLEATLDLPSKETPAAASPLPLPDTAESVRVAKEGLEVRNMVRQMAESVQKAMTMLGGGKTKQSIRLLPDGCI